MAGFISYADIIERLFTDGQYSRFRFFKTTSPTSTLQTIQSAWLHAGQSPNAGANPATTPGTVYNRDKGSISCPDAPAARKYIAAANAYLPASSAFIVLYDRLVGVANLGANSTGNKTVNTQALPRYTDGAGVEAWIEITTNFSNAGGNLSLNNYTNQNGDTGKSGPAMAGTSHWTGHTAAGYMVPLWLASGDYGVRAVSTINIATAFGAAGVFNLLLIKRLAHLPVMWGIQTMIDYIRAAPPMRRVYDGATIGVAYAYPYYGNLSSNPAYPMIDLAFGWN